MQTIECQICHDYKPLHTTERIYDMDKKITACQECLDEEQLAVRYSRLTGIDYDRLIG